MFRRLVALDPQAGRAGRGPAPARGGGDEVEPGLLGRQRGVGAARSRARPGTGRGAAGAAAAPARPCRRRHGCGRRRSGGRTRRGWRLARGEPSADVCDGRRGRDERSALPTTPVPTAPLPRRIANGHAHGRVRRARGGLVVHVVVGRVSSAGLVTLAPGLRVADAVARPVAPPPAPTCRPSTCPEPCGRRADRRPLARGRWPRAAPPPTRRRVSRSISTERRTGPRHPPRRRPRHGAPHRRAPDAARPLPQCRGAGGGARHRRADARAAPAPGAGVSRRNGGHAVPDVIGSRGPDLRLVGPAVVAWAGAWVLTASPLDVAVTVAAAAILGSLLALAGARHARLRLPAGVVVLLPAPSHWSPARWRSVRRRGRRAGCPRRRHGVTWCGVRGRHDGPGARALGARPGRPLGGRRSRWVVRLRTTEVTVRGRAARARVPVVVVGDDRWSRVRWERPSIWSPGPARRAAAMPRRRFLARWVAPGTGHRPGGGGVAPSPSGRPAGLGRGAAPGRPGLLRASWWRHRPARCGLDEAMRRVGLTHLTAVSGANLAIVAGVVLLAVRRCPGPCGWRRRAAPWPDSWSSPGRSPASSVPPRWRPWGCGGWPAGAAPTVSLPWPRASWSCWCSNRGWRGPTGSRCRLRHRRPPRPRAPARRAVLPEAASPAGRGARGPGGAQAACTPVLLLLAPGISLASIPANLLAEPAVAPATVLGLLAALVSPVSPTLAHTLAWLAGWCCRWVGAVARLLDGVPASTVPWPQGRPALSRSSSSPAPPRVGAVGAARPPARPARRSRRSSHRWERVSLLPRAAFVAGGSAGPRCRRTAVVALACGWWGSPLVTGRPGPGPRWAG